ncbi:hypothetical protein LPJ61_002847 [Coemansia biformis]|uniref:PABC domain-containing protein n=1 Tax=Coemansia biformis TaxID=1286918 RepID=A0A9W7Y7L9_9FUNG|nr:hypothetical protein LPJ61_002847 [Coemansia biformis]
MPFPHAPSTSSPHSSDPLLDPTMLHNLSESSRTEILVQKLSLAVASNPDVDVRDASNIVDSFITRSVEDILALLSDPSLLVSEWDLEKRANMHLPFHQSSLGTPVNQDSSPAALPTDANGDAATGDPAPAPSGGGGISVPNYNTETEEYIEMLISKPESERKKKLGCKLFPLIKGMGYKDSTKLTVWILDHMGQDVRTLAYTLNDPAKLTQIIHEAQESITTARAA